MAPETLIALGYVASPHATHGELRVRLFNPASTVLGGAGAVFLRRGTHAEQRRIRGVRPHRHALLLTIEGCESMTAAEQLVGYEVCVRAADLPPVAADEIYHHELLGMTVVTTGGAAVGVVAEVLAVPSNDVCVVRAADREHLIPLIADVVKRVDREQRRLVIDPLPGLLDG